MLVLLTVALLVAIVGIVRPFKGLKRKHFAMIAAGLFVACLIATPTPQKATPTKVVSPEEAKALALKNKNQITKLSAEARGLPASDVEGKLGVFSALADLDPGTAEFARQRDKYAALIENRKRYEDKPQTALEIVHLDWRKGGFGSIMMLEATITNHAPFNIKDFELRCVHQGPSGTDMDSNTRTIYEIVPANGSKRVSEINMGFINSQVVTSRCEVTGAVKA